MSVPIKVVDLDFCSCFYDDREWLVTESCFAKKIFKTVWHEQYAVTCILPNKTFNYEE